MAKKNDPLPDDCKYHMEYVMRTESRPYILAPFIPFAFVIFSDARCLDRNGSDDSNKRSLKGATVIFVEGFTDDTTSCS